MIVRYTAEEIKEMIRKGETNTDWERLDNMTDEEVERNALEDNRRHGIPDDWYKDAVLMRWPPKVPDENQCGAARLSTRFRIVSNPLSQV